MKERICGIINYDKKEVVTADELVKRFFPRNQEISKKDWLKIRQEVFRLFRERGNIRRNWADAFRVVAQGRVNEKLIRT